MVLPHAGVFACLMLAVLGTVSLLIAQPAHATTFTVNVTDDLPDQVPGGACDVDAAAGNQCSLRAAIQIANASAGPHAINLPAGTYTITRSGIDNSALSGDLDIVTEISIVGAGAATTFVQALTAGDGDGIDRVFDVRHGARLTLTGATVQNGTSSLASGGGGGILNAGTTVLRGVVVRNNRADFGGGILNAGALSVTESVISGNLARGTIVGGGGGLFNLDGNAALTNVTISNNTASTAGGGIVQFPTNGSAVTLSNVTVVANTAFSAGAGGGGLRSTGPGLIRLKNTIVANNVAPNNANADNCSESGEPAAFASDAFNLLYPAPSSIFGRCRLSTSQLDLIDQDPRLAPLQDNGGGLPTHALLANSPAIDAGDPNDCIDNAGPLDRDQRNLLRPRDGNADDVIRCDIGAYDFQVPFPADLSVTVNDAPDPIVVGEDLIYTVIVRNAGPATSTGVTLTHALSSGVAFVSGSGPGGISCTQASGTATCNLGVLANGGERTVTIVTRPTTGGTKTSASIVSADQLDTANPGNNSAGTSTVVIAACAPRPPVAVQVTPDGAGRLRATLTARPSTQISNNALRSIRLTRLSNATVDVQDGPANAAVNTDIPLTMAQQPLVLTVRRTAPGPFTVHVMLTDRCGSWTTFVGGGANVP